MNSHFEFTDGPNEFVAGQTEVALGVLKSQLEAHRVTPCITENGHMAHLEDTEIVVKAVKEFLRNNS